MPRRSRDWELPHGLGGFKTGEGEVGGPQARKRKAQLDNANDNKKLKNITKTSIDQGSKRKYDVSPFPTHSSPTHEEAVNVANLLVGEHGAPYEPKELPPASEEVAGCGNVSDVTEATMRTLLSGAVTMGAANNMLVSLIAAFPAPKDSSWTIDWKFIRQSVAEEQLDQKKLAKVLSSGGLQNLKAGHIIQALQIIYDANMYRMSVLQKELDTGVATTVTKEHPEFPALSNLSAEKKASIIALLKKDALSLDWLHMLDDNRDILDVLQTIRGVSVKTASCVVLFSLQRPSFAVDTHVHRMCTWLGWVPDDVPGNAPEKTFYHCDLKVPDHLKYQLHQLFIRHGQDCFRCTGKSVPGTKQWNETECVLEKLLDRNLAHKKKGVAKNGGKGKQAGSASDEGNEAGVKDIDDEVKEDSMELVATIETDNTESAHPSSEEIKEETSDSEEKLVETAAVEAKKGRKRTRKDDDDDDYQETKPSKRARLSAGKKVG
ncbi:hypothetical protein HYALB_00007930 [Hymenoscyphus albidus]|uniref:HhH-GPD domain-containing protein n=1 Tax=Hymenoscyphus albidus TaxID=595503 RepID=A0A9N9Q6S2_9HELO|nr:hypothetical protein HYALB_00007930 [Hymenoscyphus albidus]